MVINIYVWPQVHELVPIGSYSQLNFINFFQQIFLNNSTVLGQSSSLNDREMFQQNTKTLSFL